MLLSPLRCTPYMLGGVGYQAGLDQVQRERDAERRAAAARAAAPAEPDLVEQLKGLKALRDEGMLSPDEFLLAKRKVLGS